MYINLLADLYIVKVIYCTALNLDRKVAIIRYETAIRDIVISNELPRLTNDREQGIARDSRWILQCIPTKR
jgi:hypothetical protein